MTSLDQIHTCPSPTQVHCSATATTKAETELNQPQIESMFVTPQPSLTTASTTTPEFIDQTMMSTWLACGCTTVLISLAKFIIGAANSYGWFAPMLAGFVGYVVADLVSGVHHWAIDNYGNPSTPIFGDQIEAFQRHHKLPLRITRHEFANRTYAFGRVVTFIVLPIDIFCDNPIIHGFVSVLSGCALFSQQFHIWAHGTKSQLPPLVVVLQDLGILLSRSQHAAHHRPPYNSNYCIISGVWNKFLDKQKVFEALEKFLFVKLGLKPRSWSKPN